MPQPLGFTDRSFAFFAGLEADNSKMWFEANRSLYEEAVKGPMEALIAVASAALAQRGEPLRGGPKSLFRLHRDTRFSNDKSPYKTHQGALLTRTGARKDAGTLLYCHIEAGGGFIGAGAYRLSAAELGPIRQRLIDEAAAFTEALARLDADGLSLGDDESSLSKLPRGFTSHKDHPLAEHLKRKSFIVSQDVPKADWISGAVVDHLLVLAAASRPLRDFLDAARGIEGDVD